MCAAVAPGGSGGDRGGGDDDDPWRWRGGKKAPPRRFEPGQVWDKKSQKLRTRFEKDLTASEWAQLERERRAVLVEMKYNVIRLKRGLPPIPIFNPPGVYKYVRWRNWRPQPPRRNQGAAPSAAAAAPPPPPQPLSPQPGPSRPAPSGSPENPVLVTDSPSAAQVAVTEDLIVISSDDSAEESEQQQQ